jgi:hypothetical protein
MHAAYFVQVRFSIVSSNATVPSRRHVTGGRLLQRDNETPEPSLRRKSMMEYGTAYLCEGRAMQGDQLGPVSTAQEHRVESTQRETMHSAS